MSNFVENLKKFDNLWTGVAGGIILPVLVYLVTYFSEVRNVSSTIFSDLKIAANIMPVLISHCILPDLLLFFIFMGAGWQWPQREWLGSQRTLTVLVFAL
jgi:hypothetical protein